MNSKKPPLSDIRKDIDRLPDEDTSPTIQAVDRVLKQPVFETGQGSARREANINVIMKALANGFSKEEIWFIARMKFTRPKFEEYWLIAESNVINLENNGKSL